MKVVLFCGGYGMRMRGTSDLPEPMVRVGPRPLIWQLLAYPYHGCWQPADTVKERNELEARYQSGNRPWMVWDRDPDRAPLVGVMAPDRGA